MVDVLGAARPARRVARRELHRTRDTPQPRRRDRAAEEFAPPHPLRPAHGKDLIGITHTGTGKTATFVLPILNPGVGRPDRAERAGAREDDWDQNPFEQRRVGKPECGHEKKCRGRFDTATVFRAHHHVGRNGGCGPSCSAP